MWFVTYIHQYISNMDSGLNRCINMGFAMMIKWINMSLIKYFTGCPLGPGLPPLPVGPASPFQHKIIICKILSIYMYEFNGEKVSL